MEYKQAKGTLQDRIARIRNLTGDTELRSDVSELLDRFSKSEVLPAVPRQIRDFAERYASAWCSQNAASVAAFYSLNGSLCVNYGPPAVERNAIAKEAQGFMTAFPDMVVLLDDLLSQGDRTIFCWTLVGTNTGSGGTGKKVRISGFEVWRIGPDELIAESLGHFDSVAYQHQLRHGADH